MEKNNYQLLKLAATVGNLDYIDCYPNMFFNHVTGDSWNPLESDRDAFQLMVELGIGLFFGNSQGGTHLTVTTMSDKRRKTEWKVGEDEPAHIRRAIVEAAAKVNEQ